MEIPINLWAVLVSAVISMVLGGIWYGPLFGNAWMRMVGLTPESVTAEQKKGMWKSYLLMFVGSFLMAYVLAHSLFFASSYLQVEGIMAALESTFWTWLGFIAPVTIGVVLWEQKPWKLWFINAGYFLVSLLISAVIISLWK